MCRRRLFALRFILPLFAGALMQPAPAHAGRLRVRIDLLPCPQREAIGREIEEGAQGLLEGRGELMLVILQESEEMLRVLLYGAQSPFEKRLPFTAKECDELPTVASLLLQSWLGMSIDEKEPEEEARMPVESELAMQEVSGEASTSTWTLVAAPRAGIAGGLGEQWQWTPSMALGLGLRAPTPWPEALSGSWGLELVGRYDAPFIANSAQGSVRAELFALALEGLYSTNLGESVRLSMAVGPALEWTHGSTSIAGRSEATLTSAALACALGLTVPLNERLSLSTSLEALMRPRGIAFTYGRRVGLELAPVRLALLTGLSWDFASGGERRGEDRQ